MNRIEAALKRTTDTKAVEIGPGVAMNVGKLFQRLFPGKKAIIVADTTTYRIVGSLAEESLRAEGLALEKPFIFSYSGLHAEWHYVEQLEERLASTDAIPVAVGSGTINDLTKLAAHHQGRKYICVATAASMDGYTAYGASITRRGSKQTFDCPAPLGVVADTRIIAEAPAQMSASGYADLFAKITAGADWIVAQEMGVENIDRYAFSVVQEGLKDALSDPAGVRKGDIGAVGPLVEGLLMGGFAMQAARSSRPASGAEHQFSHLWDMEHHTHEGAVPSHGFKVGVGTLASLALYEQMLATPMDELDIDVCVAAYPDSQRLEYESLKMFEGTDFPLIGAQETMAKNPTAEELREQLALLRDNWPGIRQRLREQLLPLVRAKESLSLAGAPIEPEQIGISRRRLGDSYIRAQHIRRRFTILDVAVRTGMMERWLDAIFGPCGMWEIREK